MSFNSFCHRVDFTDVFYMCVSRVLVGSGLHSLPSTMGVNVGQCCSRPELVRVQLCPPVGKVNHRMGVCILPPRLVINLVFSVTQGTKEGGQRSVRGMLPLGRHFSPWPTVTTAHARGLFPRRTTLP